MSHHDHHHGNDHDHHHAHSHDVASQMTFDEKLAKLLSHWIRHNDDHATSYHAWAEKARAQNFGEAADLLAEAAQMTHAISQKFEQALERLTPI